MGRESSERGVMQADAGWETAVAVLKTVLNIALDTVASPSVMLRLKDFVLLVCSALGECRHTWLPTDHSGQVWCTWTQ